MKQNSLEQIPCSNCGNDMPKLRKQLYGYKVCVNCSTEKPKVGRIMTYGTGDHTWNDLQILDQETALKLYKVESKVSTKNIPLEILNLDTDEFHAEREIKEKVDTLLQVDDIPLNE